jgi:hypothetical protein
MTSRWIKAHQSNKGADHFCVYPKPDPTLPKTHKAALAKKAYTDLRNSDPKPKSPPGKNKLFNMNSAFLVVAARTTVNSYQFAGKRTARKSAKRTTKKSVKRKGKK